MSLQPPGSQPPEPDESAGGNAPPPPGWGNSPSGGYPPPGDVPPGGYPPPGGLQPPPPYQPPGPSGPPGGYGQPGPAGGYGQPGAYPPPAGGYQPPGSYPSPAGTAGALAEWPQRALGGLIDFVAPWLVVGVISQASDVLGFFAWIASLVWFFYNAYLNGTTGQSIGKQTVGLKVVSAETGQTIGGGMGVVRAILHIVDSIPCYVGYLWPLWDGKKQTFADKIVKTVVIVVPN
jgi:uncharacterized RDD family membrane protein YckC